MPRVRQIEMPANREDRIERIRDVRKSIAYNGKATGDFDNLIYVQVPEPEPNFPPAGI